MMDFFYDHDSALMGAKPKNDVDLKIIQGIYRAFGVSSDPSLGYVYAPKAPTGYVHESKQPYIVAGMCVVILAVVVPTVARIMIKLRAHHTEFGLDDITIVIAAVS
jgi:hypothetical protein